jgi:hypothetical protein
VKNLLSQRTSRSKEKTMSATIPESMRLDDLLKATGYDCPAELQGKTFDQATEGGGADLEDNKTVSITENGVVEITPSEGKDGMKKVTATVNVSGGADLEDNKAVSITENGTIEITPSEGKDGMKKVTATVNVSYSLIALSDSIAKTVGATSSIEYVHEAWPWRIGAKGYGIGQTNIYGKISLTDLIALGSKGATVAVEGGPGELVLKLTATLTPGQRTGWYNVTGEVVSVGSMYLGDSVQVVLLA